MDIKKSIISKKFHFNKKYGQNFLSDDSILNKIADSAELCKTDTVVEIGMGAGSLTKVLAQKANNVIGYEIDRTLAPVLAETLSGIDNISLIFADFMTQTPDDLQFFAGDRFTVVANLPYYITTPITMKILEEFFSCDKLVIMVQKEVAKRFTAKPGTKDYGAITAAIDYYGDAEYLFEVTREYFYPVPNVDSAVIKITRNKKYSPLSESAFKKTLQTAFAARRKTLVNNLTNNLSISKDAAEGFLVQMNLPLNIRGEVLSTEQFVELSNLLYNAKILD